ncbi:hypothetical protein [Spirillospora sp. NPDC029432]|uniref:hypothetical protein n=1 Tax=Spirillospora sp. NPDC029432 TaxID=3154599 RepID=UPI003453B502
MVFAYASRYNVLDGTTRIDNEVLDVIGSMVGHQEVAAHRGADWEKAILSGYTAWKKLRDLGGGMIDLDMPTQTLTVTPLPVSQAAHGGRPPAFRCWPALGRAPRLHP